MLDRLTPIFTPWPVNPGGQVDRATFKHIRNTHNDMLYVPLALSTLGNRLTGRQVNKYGIPLMPCTPIFTSGPINPGGQVDRSEGEHVRNTHNVMHNCIYLRTCQPGGTGCQVDR